MHLRLSCRVGVFHVRASGERWSPPRTHTRPANIHERLIAGLVLGQSFLAVLKRLSVLLAPQAFPGTAQQALDRGGWMRRHRTGMCTDHALGKWLQAPETTLAIQNQSTQCAPFPHSCVPRAIRYIRGHVLWRAQGLVASAGWYTVRGDVRGGNGTCNGSKLGEAMMSLLSTCFSASPACTL